MSKATLEAVQARQTELAAMIQELGQAASIKVITPPETRIELRPGEHYAGQVLDSDGKLLHHLVLMAERHEGTLNWKGAMEWASSVGGALPTRQEQALLYANCKPYLQPAWHSSCEAHESDASCAWFCHFGNGYQYDYLKSYRCRAVCVRRIHLVA